jgi:hypothetical protein
MRAYRLHVATRDRRHGGRLRPHTVRGSHSALATFMRWSDAEGYDVDLSILDLPGTRLPALEAEVFHMEQLLAILEACNPAAPQEALAVRILVGSGLRASELCGLALTAPDGGSDVLMDRLPGGAELRVRWDAGTKGRKSAGAGQDDEQREAHTLVHRHDGRRVGGRVVREDQRLGEPRADVGLALDARRSELVEAQPADDHDEPRAGGVQRVDKPCSPQRSASSRSLRTFLEPNWRLCPHPSLSAERGRRTKAARSGQHAGVRAATPRHAEGQGHRAAVWDGART